MRLFTNSELSTWRHCRRRWWLTYARRLGPIREETVSAASLGTLVHLGLEAHYTGGDALAVMQARVELDRETLVELDDAAKLKKFDAQSKLALTMVEGYIEWLEEAGADADWEILGSEMPVTAEWSDDVEMLGKLDLLIRERSTGLKWIVDFKTAASITEWEEQAYRNRQFRFYQQLVPDADGVIVRVLRKVGRSATAKPPFYGEVRVSFNEHTKLSTHQQTYADVHQIQEAEKGLDALGNSLAPWYLTPNPSRDCSWICPFKAVCPMFDDGSDAEAVIQFSYVQRDPLERYGDLETEGAE